MNKLRQQINLRLDRKMWEDFAYLCSTYNTDRTKSIRNLIKNALDGWCLPGYVPKPNPRTAKK